MNPSPMIFILLHIFLAQLLPIDSLKLPMSKEATQIQPDDTSLLANYSETTDNAFYTDGLEYDWTELGQLILENNDKFGLDIWYPNANTNLSNINLSSGYELSFPSTYYNSSTRHGNGMAIPIVYEDDLHFNNTIEDYPYLRSENSTPDRKSFYLGVESGDPQRYNYSIMILLGVYYAVLLVIGIPGNILTGLVILTNSHMQTAPNMYILNLTIVDVVTLAIVVPLEAVMIYKMYSWPLGDFGCGIATFLSELVTYVSIVTMIMFSIERYFVICHPQTLCVLSGKRRTKAIIALIWVVCMLPAMTWWNSAKVHFTYMGLDYSTNTTFQDHDSMYQPEQYITIKESAMCLVNPNAESSLNLGTRWITTILLYFLPATILPLIYFRITKVIKKDGNRAIYQSRRGKAKYNDNGRTLVKLWVTIIGCFLISWTPYHVRQLLHAIARITKTENEALLRTEDTLVLLSGCFYYLSAAINPILYGVISMRFRNGFINIKSSCKQFVFAKKDHPKASNHNVLPIAATDRNTNRRRVTFSGQTDIYPEDSRKQNITPSPSVGMDCNAPIPMIIVYRQGSEWI